jgi:hypothetical protein
VSIKPILFSGPMVRALLDGRKTQTRRLLKPQPEREQETWDWRWTPPGYPERHLERFYWRKDSHPGSAINWHLAVKRGDVLWVREAFSYDRLDVDRDGALPPWYWADGNPEAGDWTKPKPSIHMPRWASRTTLEVTDIRVQQLHDISEEDAIAEGVTKVRDYCHVIRGFDYDEAGLCHTHATTPFAKLWNHINGPDAWSTNPWVVALTFTVHKCNVDEFQKLKSAA